MKEALTYTLKVWLTTIVLATLFYMLFSWYKVYSGPDYYVNPFVFKIYYYKIESICFLPVCLLFTIITSYLNATWLKAAYKKVYLTLSAVIFSLLPFLIVVNYVVKGAVDLAPLLYTYTGFAIISVWFYKLKPVVKDQMVQPQV